MKLKKGDLVQVMMGKDKGKTGKIERVLPAKNMIVVEGLNLYKRHIKGVGQGQTSEIKVLTRPMPVSKVSLVDPKTKKPTRVGFKMEKKVKVRTAKKSGQTL
ncbi:MAG TPA: 50S ribosomal protein L24 [Candidatus Levybacteria bacterium]|nr:50S ribosomal protein L24 [Candidatus Levybacteria bacterium]